MKRIALLLLASCAIAPAPAAPVDSWRQARMIEALVNGCSRSCPADDENCVDEYGLCYTPCAWGILSAAERKALHESAMETDPSRTFLIDCLRPEGQIEAAR